MGLFNIILGFLLFLIPIIGWIFGWFFIITGIIMVIAGIIGQLFKIPFLLMGDKKKEVQAQQAAVIAQEPKLDISGELEKLSLLLEKGHITKEEFDTSKKALLEKY